VSYATPAQLDSLALPVDVQNATTEAQKQDALDAAQGVIHSYLSQGGYTVPLPAPGDDLLEAEVAIAAWRLAVTANLAPEGGAQSNLYLRNKDASRWLEAIAMGKARPTGAQESQTGSAYSPPKVTSADGRGW